MEISLRKVVAVGAVYCFFGTPGVFVLIGLTLIKYGLSLLVNASEDKLEK